MNFSLQRRCRAAGLFRLTAVIILLNPFNLVLKFFDSELLLCFLHKNSLFY